MYIPPAISRSRSFTRFTMRVGLPHFGQSVDFDVSIAFLRSPVFAILAMDPDFSPLICSRLTPDPYGQAASTARPQSLPIPKNHPEPAPMYLLKGITAGRKNGRLAPLSLHETILKTH